MEASSSSFVRPTRARTLAFRRLHQMHSTASSSCHLQLRSLRLEKFLLVGKPPKPHNPRNLIKQPKLGFSMRTTDTKKSRVAPPRVSASAAVTEEEMVLEPIKGISGTVKLPGSKSLSNRILLLAALA